MGWGEVDSRSHLDADAEHQNHIALVVFDVLWVVGRPLMPLDRKRQSTIAKGRWTKTGRKRTGRKGKVREKREKEEGEGDITKSTTNTAKHIEVEVKNAQAGVPHSVHKAFLTVTTKTTLHVRVLRLPDQQTSRGEALGL
jgi:hypothetical protein